MLLFCTVIFCSLAYSLSTPICCQNANYYADFLLALKCNIVLCKRDEKILSGGNLCISCSPKELPVQDASQDVVRIGTPQPLCHYLEIRNETLLGNLVLTWPWHEAKHSPIVYIIEARSHLKSMSEWNFVGMTNETFADVSNLVLGYMYQFRITSIISTESIMHHKLSDWISVAGYKQNITAPTGINITGFKIKYKYLEAVVNWNASKEMPCSYKIFWSRDNSDIFEQQTMNLPGDSLSVVLPSLLFETKYIVIIKPHDQSKSKFVQSAEASFVTPSCLDVTQSNFSLCAPGYPLNVSVQWLNSSEALLTWLHPTNASAKNNIKGYHIVVEEDTGLFKEVLRYKTTLSVGPNTTNTTISNLKYSSHYVFGIKAISKGGTGLSTVVELNARNYSVTSLNVQTMPFLFIVPLFIFPLIVAIGLSVHITCRKHSKKETCPSGVADVGDDIRPFLIPSEKVELREIVGEGAFGTVHRGLYFRSKSVEEVAVKVYPSETIKRGQMLHEVNMLRVLGRHENIVAFVGFTLGFDKMALLFEYCRLGNLHCHLVSLKPELMYMKSLPSSERPAVPKENCHGIRLSSYIYQVAKGMEYISDLKIVHRDIAARNILMQNERTVKISDFGLSKDIYQNKYYASLAGNRFPIKWMAPEAIEKQKFSTFSDVWSFGVFMWEVFRLGKEPYPGINNSNILQYLKMGNRMEKPHCSEEWYSIMKACWLNVPSKRPMFKELVNMIATVIESSTHYVVLSQ